jgi:predicted nucleic acid-binding protein
MPKAKSIVLDSWAIMAYLEDEPAGEKVADLIADAHDNGVPLLMTVVNAGEIWYIVARRTTPAEADRTIKLLTDIGIKFIDADWPLTKIAASFKVNGNISYADSYAAALAKHQGATLITGDNEFKQLEQEVNISWLNE